MALPDYLTDQTEEVIRKRILDALPSDLDKTEGSYIWDAVTPVAIELALNAQWAQEVLRRTFASTTFGEYLDLRCGEHGLERKAAVKSTGTSTKSNALTITGTPGTVVAAGFGVATPADSITGTSSVEFVTTAGVIIGGGGTVAANIEAIVAGKAGNVPIGSISLITTPVSGVFSVTNAAAIDGGADIEDDKSLLERYLQKVRNPSAGGNKADYINWAGEVAGVGGVAVVPLKYGNGTVSVAIIGTDKTPAGAALIDTVLDYIAKPWDKDVEAETMTVGGSGTAIDATQGDDSGNSVKMEYNVAGEGTIVHANVNTILDKPGIWQARPKVKASSIAGANNLLQVGIWNVTTAAWAKVSSAVGAADARTVYPATGLSLAFAFLVQPFYWNGVDVLELRINRLLTDTTTVVWVDLAKYRSTFSRDTGDGKAPIGAAVYIEAATAKTINVTATLAIKIGYDVATVKAAAATAVDNYLKGIAFKDVSTPGKEVENDVKYARIASAILDTVGVEDYSNLLVNGGTANITVAAQEVAIKGTVTFS